MTSNAAFGNLQLGHRTWPKVICHLQNGLEQSFLMKLMLFLFTLFLFGVMVRNRQCTEKHISVISLIVKYFATNERWINQCKQTWCSIICNPSLIFPRYLMTLEMDRCTFFSTPPVITPTHPDQRTFAISDRLAVNHVRVRSWFPSFRKIRVCGKCLYANSFWVTADQCSTIDEEWMYRWKCFLGFMIFLFEIWDK